MRAPAPAGSFALAFAFAFAIAVVGSAGAACAAHHVRPNLPPPEYEEEPAPDASAPPEGPTANGFDAGGPGSDAQTQPGALP